MFEQPEKQPNLLLKILPIAALVLVAVVALLIYVSRRPQAETAELTGIVRAGDPMFDWYENYLRLEEDSLNIQLGQNFAGQRMVMFSGIIENGGERTVDVVEVKLVLFNYEDPVWETTRTPIRPGPYTRPIPPLERRSFTLYLGEIPQEWHASNAEMSIHGFRFR
jgi:hypothetical protein